MSDFEKLNIILAARDREFSKAMERNTARVERFARKTEKDLSRTSRGFDLMGNAAKMATPFLAALSAGAVIGGLKSTVARLDDIGKTADKIGLTTDALQELRVVAESAGVAQAQLDTAMLTFGKTIGEAAQGIGRGRIAFKALGLDAEKLQAMGLDAALSRIADALKFIESPAERTAIAMKLFGEAGAGMLNLLREGSDGMERMRSDARALGVVIDESLVRNAEEAQTKLDMMSRVISAQLSSALINLAPLLINAAEGVISITQAVRDFLAIDFSMPELMNADQLRDYAAGYQGIENQLSDMTRAQAAYNANVAEFGENSEQAQAWAKRLASAQDTLTTAINERKAAEAAEGRAVEGIKDIAAATAAAREKARLSEMGAEAAEREKIAKEKTAKAETILADIMAARGAVTDQERAQVAQIADNWERAQIAASGVLNGGKKSGAGKAAGSAKAEEYVRILERVQEELVAAGGLGAGFDLQLSAIEARFNSGQITGEEYAAALEEIGQKYDDLQSTAETMEGATEDMFASIITGSKSAGDALSDLLAQWAGMAAKSAFSGLFGGMFDSVAAIFTPGASFDGGGYTGSGPRSGGLDGKGGYLAMMHPQESVIDHTKGQAAPASGGGSLQISVTVNGARGNQEITEMVQAGVRQGLEYNNRAVLPRLVGQITKDPRKIS